MTEISIKRRLLNRLRYTHKMEYFVIVKHSKIDLFVLIRKLSKIFCYREKKQGVFTYLFMCVCVPICVSMNSSFHPAMMQKSTGKKDWGT